MVKVLLVVFALAMAALGQQGTTGEIAGRVIDQNGGGLPGVHVTIQAEGATTSSALTTTADGRFSAAQLAPNAYYVSCYLRGFKYLTREGVRVVAGGRAQVALVLEVESTDAWWAHEPHAAAADAVQRVRGREVPVSVDTAVGTFYMAIDVEHAPITSANFLKYVDAHLYDGGTFHRATRPENYNTILPNRPMMNLIQGGINPARRAEGFPPIPLERTSVTGLKHLAGTVSMARGTPDSATSDFFVLLDDQPSLDFGGKRFDDAQGAAAFGRVLANMSAVRAVQQEPVTGQNLAPPVEIRSISRVK